MHLTLLAVTRKSFCSFAGEKHEDNPTQKINTSITHDVIKKSVHYSEHVSQLDSTASAMETFQIESCVRGHHIYKDIQNPSSGEELTCSREIEDTKDLLAVAVKCGTTIVGHVRRKISESACDYIKIVSRAGNDQVKKFWRN